MSEKQINTYEILNITNALIGMLHKNHLVYFCTVFGR